MAERDERGAEVAEPRMATAEELAKYTPEPWFITAFGVCDEPGQEEATRNLTHIVSEDDTWIAQMLQTDCTPDAYRICACVNALAGIEDPAAFVTRCRSAEERLKGMEEANERLTAAGWAMYREISRTKPSDDWTPGMAGWGLAINHEALSTTKERSEG